VRVTADDATVAQLVDRGRRHGQEPSHGAAQAPELSRDTAHTELIGVRSGCL
jgi:hypothetical protein